MKEKDKVRVMKDGKPYKSEPYFIEYIFGDAVCLVDDLERPKSQMTVHTSSGETLKKGFSCQPWDAPVKPENKMEKAKKRAIESTERLMQSPAAQEAMCILWTEKEALSTSFYLSYNYKTKEKAENAARAYGTSLEELREKGCAGEEKESCKALGWKAQITISTKMEDRERFASLKKRLYDETGVKLNNEENSSWGADKNTIDSSSFWFVFIKKFVLQ